VSTPSTNFFDLGTGAVLSDCGTYRYALQRDGWLTGSGTVLFVMLNPSTADASADDQTIRWCVRFAQRWGFKRLHVANLYAFRATNPAALAVADDPVGAENDVWLAKLANLASETIAAWGASPHATETRISEVLEMLGHDDLQCLGLTANGRPRHPLYLRADTEPIPLPPRPAA
jgi:hypothetical protein